MAEAQSAVREAVARNAAALDANIEDNTRALARVYRSVIANTRARALMLAEEIERLRAAGVEVSKGKLVRMERYNLLLTELARDLRAVNGEATDAVIASRVQSVWLATQHAEAVERATLGDDLYAQVSPVFVAPDRAVAAASSALMGADLSGAPVRDYLLHSMTVATADVLEQAVQAVVVAGEAPRAVAAAAAKATSVGLSRATTIVRTEAIRSYHQATRERWGKSGVVQQYKRVCQLNPRTCAACIALDGTIWDAEEDMEDHPNGGCLAPGTLVSGPVPVAFVSRHYRGDMIFLRTAGGKQVTVTPNHPVLTDRGWVAAECIAEGDNVVCEGGLQGAAGGVGPDEYQMPTPVEDVGRTLCVRRLGSVPTAPEDFHGDGGGSDVHVVSANRFLRNAGNATILQPSAQQPFGRGRVELAQLAGAGDLAAMLLRLRHASGSGLRCGDAGSDHLRGQLCSGEACRRLLAATVYASLAKAYLNELARNAEGFGEGFLRLPGQVAGGQLVNRDASAGNAGSSDLPALDGRAGFGGSEQAASLEVIREALLGSAPAGSSYLDAVTSNVVTDRVLEVSRRAGWAGHVYNLQTQPGWYSANGIITHNCAMIAVFVIDGEVIEPDMERAVDWFGRQDEATQRKILGPTRLGMWQRGEFALEDVAMRREHEVFGGSWVPRSVRDLRENGEAGAAAVRERLAVTVTGATPAATE